MMWSGRSQSRIRRFQCLVVGVVCLWAQWPAFGDALDNWTSNQFSTNMGVGEVVYGNGRYVGLGGNDVSSQSLDLGLFASSEDGLNWTARSSTSMANLTSACYDLAFGNGTFVAVGWAGGIYSSTDGLTWVNQAYLPVPNLNGVAYGNGQFVAVGDVPYNGGGSFVTNAFKSVDGVKWTPLFGYALGSMRDVAFGNGVFLAIGSQDARLYSCPGAIFSSLGSLPARGLSISFCKDRFIIPIGPGTNVVYMKQDPIFPFFSLSAQSTGVPATFQKVAYYGGLFFATIWDSAPSTFAGLYTSVDGTNWIRRNLQNAGGVFGLAFGNGRVMAVNGNKAFLSDPLAGISLVPGARPPQLSLSGLAARSYRIDYLDSLPANGTSQWQPLTNFTIPASPYIWTDTQATNSQRFYRSVLLP